MVTYTDSSTLTQTIYMSDWYWPGATQPGEQVVLGMPYLAAPPGYCPGWGCSWASGFLQPTNENTAIVIYGYSINLDPTKTVKSIALPGAVYLGWKSARPTVLAMDLIY